MNMNLLSIESENLTLFWVVFFLVSDIEVTIIVHCLCCRSCCTFQRPRLKVLMIIMTSLPTCRYSGQPAAYSQSCVIFCKFRKTKDVFARLLQLCKYVQQKTHVVSLCYRFWQPERQGPSTWQHSSWFQFCSKYAVQHRNILNDIH